MTSVELAGRGAQEEVSLAQLRGDEGRETNAQLKCAVTACEDLMVVSILVLNIHLKKKFLGKKSRNTSYTKKVIFSIKFTS